MYKKMYLKEFNAVIFFIEYLSNSFLDETLLYFYVCHLHICLFIFIFRY